MDEVCGVCCENFSKSTRKSVTCSHCDFVACRRCCQTYMLSTEKDPHCMNCNTIWDRGFVDTFCTKHFRNTEYRRHRENVLFEREKLLMPETQPQVERIMSMRRLNAILRAHKERLVQVHTEIMQTDGNIRDHPELVMIYRNMENIYNTLETLRQGINSTAVEPRKFVHKCPTEDCKGFLSENMFCGMCNKHYCEKCNDVKEEGHVCDPDSVKTMELIRRDSKPCPKCGQMIHRTDGCAQMWCTACHCPFDWRTGEIEKGRIHNPHFVEYQRKSRQLSREHGDIPCGGIPSFRELREKRASTKILNYAIVVYETERLYTFLDTRPADNLSFRIGYMLNDISEKDFKSIIQRQEKFTDRVRDIQHIYEMIIHAGGDILRQYLLDDGEEERHEHYLTMLQGVVDYSNEVFASIRERYNCRLPKNIIL